MGDDLLLPHDRLGSPHYLLLPRECPNQADETVGNRLLKNSSPPHWTRLCSTEYAGPNIFITPSLDFPKAPQIFLALSATSDLSRLGNILRFYSVRNSPDGIPLPDKIS